MVQKITEGVSVSVDTFYQPAQSNAMKPEHVFVYRITIENQTPHPIKVQRRHWIIVDSNGITKEVEGEGVVGRKPVIEPGASYQYISSTLIVTDIGKMYGTYEVTNLYNRKNFKVAIPEFPLVYPYKLN
jgi:ApaG protein